MPKFEVPYKATVESLVVVDAPTAEKARELVARRGTDAGVVTLATTHEDFVGEAAAMTADEADDA